MLANGFLENNKNNNSSPVEITQITLFKATRCKLQTGVRGRRKGRDCAFEVCGVAPDPVLPFFLVIEIEGNIVLALTDELIASEFLSRSI